MSINHGVYQVFPLSPALLICTWIKWITDRKWRK